MPSLIPGYAYDIFISYRQKDNKGDRWVTEFVNALKTELEATFKEEVSVYFDENPHDGLLETHQVGQSLSSKIKSLVFIPIISQTYCDPKSFAWEHEFLAFMKMANEDKFGKNIMVSRGNVSNRVLPVKIHELDAADTALLENELGGPVRSVNFIYKSAGVNRPLRVNEDNPSSNLNKTFYRDQVNKVANAVKEIIRAMENPDDAKQSSGSLRTGEKREDKSTGTKRKIFTLSSTAIFFTSLVLCLIFYFFIYRSPDLPDKSIAVLPFEDLSQEHDQEYFSAGMTDEIRTHLSKIGDLKVISRQSSMKYKGVKISAPEIAKELGITNLLTGSVRKSGDRVKISVQLIDTKTDKDLWSEDYDYRELKDIFAMQTDVATRIAEILKAKLTQQEKNSLSKTYTSNPQAYKLYLKGRFFWSKRSVESFDSAEFYYKRAIELDPAYALAYSGLADCYTLGLRGLTPVEEIPVAKDYVMKALSLDSTLSEAWTTVGFIQTHIEFDWAGGKPILEKAIRLNPNNPIAHLYYGNVLIFFIGDSVKGLIEVRKALELDPLSSSINWAVGNRYYNLNELDLAIKQFRKLLILDPDYAGAKAYLGLSLLQKKRYPEAVATIKTLPADMTDRAILLSLAYAEAGDKARARKELDDAMRLDHALEGKHRMVFNNQFEVFLAKAYVSIGDYEKALAQLEHAHEIRSLNMLGVPLDPILDPIRNEPRFKAILKKMNLDRFNRR